jgi:heat shock protein HslJ
VDARPQPLVSPLRAFAGSLTLIAIIAGCAGGITKPLPAHEVKTASKATLTSTHWRLTHLGGVVVDNPPGDHDLYFELQQTNTSVVGFSGCNRMFGRYALDGETLKFDAMGGTKMACDGRMELEQRFLAAFANVSTWKIANDTLVLNDGNGKPVATFQAMLDPPVNAPAG